MEEGGRVVRDPLIGSVLHERYRLLRRIGRGGMGIVYLAEHVLIGRKYAVKVLSDRANATDEMVARFHREAMAAAQVGSDHVVEVTDMGQLDDGSYFIVLEYLEGVELAKAVSSGGPFDAGRAVRIVCQLCDALSAVHDKGIVHRDLKPENLFLIEHRGRKDFVKVLDFGVCKLLDGDDERDPSVPALTRTNASLGTPQYMAPEQFHASARVDHRADIHAAAAVLYFMLTGKPPFDAPTLAQLAMRACVEPPPTLLAQRPELPTGLDAVIQHAMAKHPEDRYASSAALKQALLPFAELRAGAPGAPVTLPGPATSTFPTQPADTTYGAALRDKAPPPARVSHFNSIASSIASSLRITLPERRWPLALLAVGLTAAVLGSVIWGTWTLSRADARPRGQEMRAPASASSVQSGEPPAALDPAPVTTQPLQPPPASTTSRPALAAKPALKRKAVPLAEASAPAAAPVTPAAESSAPAAPTADPTPSKKAGDATYHFPKRAIKDVF